MTTAYRVELSTPNGARLAGWLEAKFERVIREAVTEALAGVAFEIQVTEEMPDVSLEKAARFLGIEPQTLHAWSHKGDRRFFDLGPWKNLAGWWRFPVAKLEASKRKAPKAMGLARKIRRTA